MNALEDLLERLQRKGKHLVLSAPHTHPLLVMEKAGFLDKLGRQNVCPHVDAALDRARELLCLPPAVRHGPLERERNHPQQARDEVAVALERANNVLKRQTASAQATSKEIAHPMPEESATRMKR